MKFKKIDENIILNALIGIPATELLEDWSFTIEEIAPYIFKAKGTDINNRLTTGYGDTAESALSDCVKHASRIKFYEDKKKKITNSLSEIIKKIFRY